jgi:hypothetical protein
VSVFLGGESPALSERPDAEMSDKDPLNGHGAKYVRMNAYIKSKEGAYPNFFLSFTNSHQQQINQSTYLREKQ